MLPREDVRQVLAHATVFVCPSIYEPLGIVNLEAMACETAVVASDVGGIPEVVADGETGLLVHYDPLDAEGFERGLAAAVERARAPSGASSRHGSGRPGAGDRGVRLGCRGAPDGRHLRLAAALTAPRQVS